MTFAELATKCQEEPSSRTDILTCIFIVVLLFLLALGIRWLSGSSDSDGTGGGSFEDAGARQRLLEEWSPILVAATMTVVFLGALRYAGFYDSTGAESLAKLLNFLQASDPKPTGDPTVIVADRAAHALWCVTIAAVAVAALAVMWVAAGVWLESSLRLLATVFLAAVVAGLVIYLFYWYFSPWGAEKLPALGGLASGVMLCESWLRTKSTYIGSVTGLLNIAAAILAFILAISSALTLKPVRHSDTWSGKVAGKPDPVSMREIAAAWQMLDRLLYVGSALLIAGVLEVVALHSAVLAPFPGMGGLKTGVEICKPAVEKTPLCTGLKGWAENAPVVDDLKWTVKSVTIAFGAAFSLLLASLYVPSALVLQRRLGRLTSAAPSEQARLEALKGYGLEGDLSRRLVNTVATVGPLATGLIPVVLGLLKV